jgi:hypothetical protein
MDSTEREVNTQPSTNFIDNFFSAIPVDARFNKVEFQKFVPSSGLSRDSTTIEFNLDKRDAPQCYLISKALIEVTVTIVKKDGTSVPSTSNVGPVASINNGLYSLFGSVKMLINDQLITSAPLHYPYKCYLGNLLTFNQETKSTTLQSQGWATDTHSHMETANNAGFIIRSQFWKANFTGTSAYRPEGCTFLSKFHHDLSSTNKPLPPQTRVTFELMRSTDAFYLLSVDDDTEEYKAIITSCNLYVPVGWLQIEMLKELQVRLPKQTVKYHTRRWSVRPLGIQRNKLEYYSDSLFSESENPVRIFFMIVETKAYTGNYHKNPYNFARKWTVTSAERQMNLAAEIESHAMKQQINQMQQAINFLVDRSQGTAATVPTVPQAGIQEPGPSSRPSSLEKGKGPAPRKSFLDLLISKIAGTPSRPSADDEEDPDLEIVRDAETEELLSILRKMENPVQPSEVPVRLPERLPAPELLPHLTEPKTFWLTKCQLELNSQPIGNAQYNFAVILINVKRC